MPRRQIARVGLLLLVTLGGSLSCGNQEPTEPSLPSALIAPAFSENFETSPQRESRELLIDGRPTDIEWNGSGDPAFVIARGNGGNFFVLVRTLWTFDALLTTNNEKGIYFLLQWPDLEESRLETPLVTSLDTGDEDGINTVDCNTDSRITDGSSWTFGSSREDMVYVELYSDSLADYPADRWRWGAGTTDPATPVNPTEYQGAELDETRGAANHPLGGAVVDEYNTGSGWVPDVGHFASIPNFTPGSAVPIRKPDKSTRDVRLNRGKPTAFVLWRAVSSPFAPCDTLNPLRVDDASVRDKTWHPGDYMPSVQIQLPDSSQSDVVAKGGWLDGKWSLELRRALTPRALLASGQNEGAVRTDDVALVPGRHYMVRFTFYNATKSQFSQTEFLPLYLRPRT